MEFLLLIIVCVLCPPVGFAILGLVVLGLLVEVVSSIAKGTW